MEEDFRIEARGRAVAEQALREVCLYLPSFSGLAHFVRLAPSERVSTAAVFESGRVVYNPNFFAGLTVDDALFIMAHELMHLALQTHARGYGRRRRLVNIAHDYVINDLLRAELGIDIPGGGLDLDGARDRSLEELVAWLEREDGPVRRRWRIKLVDGTWTSEAVRDALERAGVLDAGPVDAPQIGEDDEDDVLDVSVERVWFPGEGTGELARRAETVRQLSADSIARHRAWTAVRGTAPGDAEAVVDALKAAYETPWQQVLQRWFECHAPGSRSFSRPSRRGADRTDVVLPGRLREGWTVHIVLDTSGSMGHTLPRILGALRSFASSAGVDLVHVLQCDVAVTKDEWIEVENLDRVDIAGFGGSDLSPALRELARDPDVQAVLVLTDGAIGYPEETPPFDVLWVLSQPNEGFQPAYGECVVFDRRDLPG
jgi:predicted metal-dependent peptidase